MRTLADLDQDFKNWIDELLLLREKISKDQNYSSPHFPDDFIKIVASRLNEKPMPAGKTIKEYLNDSKKKI